MDKKQRSVKNTIKKVICLTAIASATCCFISISQASDVQQHENHTIEEGSELQLSHDVKVILNQEMNGIEEGMMKIIPAISSGNWDTIANIAKKIKDSFILKQKLTQEQLEELHRSLPSDFVEMDQSFHVTAGKLAHAAYQQDGELVNFYYYRLHNQCLKCHSKYASQRFPNLKKNQQGKGDHH